MTRFLIFCALLTSLTACVDGTNPFDEDVEETEAVEGEADETTDDTEAETEDVVEEEDSGIETSSGVLPGTTTPTSASSIFRREATDEDSGNGFATGFAYNSADDTFTVDNIAFDGDSPYTAVRDANGDRFGIGPFSVFEAEATAIDGLNSETVDQLVYRALYGVSDDGSSAIAIVRTAAYIPYGFGGFVYQRTGGVTLPTSGQAVYSGVDNYAGLRDFDGNGGLEYVSGDAEVRIDFDDFDDGAGVVGTISNRRIFDLEGNDLTSELLDALGDGVTELPIIRFSIDGGGVLDANGELTGDVTSYNGSTLFEEGNYYAILSGENAETITGIIVTTATDPRQDGVTVRETGGFFAYR